MNEQWFEEFRGDPDQAVSDLFSGRVGAGSNLRLDVPEILYQAFPPSLTDERAQLDRALFAWLEGMREAYPEQIKRLGFAVYAKRVGDALIALQLLELPQAKQGIRAELDAWLRWLSTLRLAPDRDPALECLRLVTRDQPEAGHTAMWLRLAADPRPEYLTVALAGLQHLPNQDNAKNNQMLMLQALIRHAVKVHYQAGGARTFFNQGFAALRGLFPRGPQHWNRVLGEALDEFLKHTGDQLSKELVDILRKQWLDNAKQSSREPRIVPVSQEEWATLESDILRNTHQSKTLSKRLFQLLDRNHRYAEATGVSHFFVRTLHNLGTPLLERHQLENAEMTRLGVMIERALMWEPTNPYCWMLWADWFRTRGIRGAHEWTLREMLRLFPTDEHALVELARVLIDQGEESWDEAEHWLRQAMKRDPDNEHSRVVMARLLMLRHRATDAEAILANFVQRRPGSQAARQSLDRLRAGLISVTADVFDQVRGNGIPAAVDRHDSPEPPPRALKELFRRGRLGGEFSRARIASAKGDVAGTDFIREETRRGDPLAGFYSQWLMPRETPECPPHAWAWNACRNWQESARPDSWRDLAMRFPEAAPETEFLHILASADDDKQFTADGWRARYCSDNDMAYRAVDVFLRKAQERLATAEPHERDELALAVMACAAADAPEFVSDRAA